MLENNLHNSIQMKKVDSSNNKILSQNLELESIDEINKSLISVSDANSNQVKNNSKKIIKPEKGTSLRINYKFFCSERNWILSKIIVSMIFFIFILGVMSFFIYVEMSFIAKPEWFSIYYLIPLGIISVVLLIFSIVNCIKYKKWKNIMIAVFNQMVDQRTLFDARHFYSRIIRNNICINWFASYIYFSTMLAILLSFIMSYLAYIYVYGGFNSSATFGILNWSNKALVDYPSNYTIYIFSILPITTIIFGCGISIFVMIIHIIWITTYYVRKSNFLYSFGELLTHDEYIHIYKLTNRINLVFYGILTLIFIIAVVIMLIMTKKIIKK